MKKLRCTSCGAELKVDDNKEYAVCEHCGSKYKLNEDVNINIKLDDNIKVTFNSIIYDMKTVGLKSVKTPRLTPSNSDRDGFNLIMSPDSTMAQIEASNHSIAKCYLYFYNRMQAMDENGLVNVGEKLITKEKFFIQITLDSEYDDEQEIFDAVNSLGMRLTSADVIKNYLFQSMKNSVKNDCDGTDAIIDDAAVSYIEAAKKLYDRAVSDAWNVDGAPGLCYTTDWDGAPVVHDRMHWTLAEAINTSAVLLPAPAS